MASEPAEAPHRVGIVEDDPTMLDHFRSVLEGAAGLEVAFVAGSLAEARAATAGGSPHLCLVDLGLPDGSGIDFLRELKSRTATKVLVTTVLGDRSTVLAVLRAGADGYILKTSVADDILAHVRQTLAGYTPISPQVATYLLDSLRPEPVGGDQMLTPREVELLEIFSRGLSYEETARVLGVTKNTVRDFVKKIYAKLSVHSRGEALFEARSLGLIDPDRR